LADFEKSNHNRDTKHTPPNQKPPPQKKTKTPGKKKNRTKKKKKHPKEKEKNKPQTHKKRKTPKTPLKQFPPGIEPRYNEKGGKKSLLTRSKGKNQNCRP